MLRIEGEYSAGDRKRKFAKNLLSFTFSSGVHDLLLVVENDFDNIAGFHR